MLESNHDVDWLQSGPYPYSLKQRIPRVLQLLAQPEFGERRQFAEADPPMDEEGGDKR